MNENEKIISNSFIGNWAAFNNFSVQNSHIKYLPYTIFYLIIHQDLFNTLISNIRKRVVTLTP